MRLSDSRRCDSSSSPPSSTTGARRPRRCSCGQRDSRQRVAPVGDAVARRDRRERRGVGRRLHGRGAPAGSARADQARRRQTSPAGAFAIRARVRLRGAAARWHARWRTRRAATSCECVDDPGSTHYAQIVARAQAGVDWKTAEHMQATATRSTRGSSTSRTTRSAIAGDGSCIFLHSGAARARRRSAAPRWPSPSSQGSSRRSQPTAVFVLFPRAVYESLAAAWGLP